MRSLAFVMLACCLHSPPYAGDDAVGPGDAGTFMDAPVDGNYSCPGGQSFGYATGLAALVPPDCANRMTIDAYGAGGGAARTGRGGKGGHLKMTISIEAGLTWFVAVGKAGGSVTAPPGGSGGIDGGGSGGSTASTVGGGGGGETDIRTTVALGSRILVVGAGGGGVTCESGLPVVGGDGGSDTGGEPGLCNDALQAPPPGEQMPPIGGLCNGGAGALGQGGHGCSNAAGGGGGAGYYGGGGGLSTGGAGGSSYVDHTLAPTVIVNTGGDNSGDGHISITWNHFGAQP